MTGKVKYPVIVLVDNVGVIFLSESALVSQRTKHMDVHYLFVWEYSEDGIIKIVFMKLKKKHLDIMTKIVGGEVYEEHVESFMAKDS